MCILAGCDFLKAIPGIGMKKAHQHIRKCRHFVRVSPALCSNCSRTAQLPTAIFLCECFFAFIPKKACGHFIAMAYAATAPGMTLVPGHLRPTSLLLPACDLSMDKTSMAERSCSYACLFSLPDGLQVCINFKKLASTTSLTFGPVKSKLSSYKIPFHLMQDGGLNMPLLILPSAARDGEDRVYGFSSAGLQMPSIWWDNCAERLRGRLPACHLDISPPKSL